MNEKKSGSPEELVMMCGKKYTAEEITGPEGILKQEVIRRHIDNCRLCKEIKQKLELGARELLRQYESGRTGPPGRGDADKEGK